MARDAIQLDERIREYAPALEGYLRHGGEAALERAYEFGRRCLAEGRSLVEMISIHSQALRAVNSGKIPSRLRAEVPVRSAEFLTECISPFEMTHRAFGEANQALRRFNEMLEEQARVIGRELHDQSGQLLAAVHIELDEASRTLPPAARARLQKVRQLLEQVEQQLREFSHQLRPTVLDDLGLVAGLESLSSRVAKRTGLHITIQPFQNGRLPETTETALYRIVEEALNNVIRHAQATAVTIRLHKAGKQLRCTIRDNGVGFDPSVLKKPGRQSGLGLLGIQERLQALHGELRVEAASGRGTKLYIQVPLEE